MSELRPLRDRLEALHAEVAAARAPGELVTSAELQHLGEELAALRAGLADEQKQTAAQETLLWEALLAVRRVQRAELARVSQYEGGRGGNLSPLAGLALMGGLMGLVLGGTVGGLGQPGPLVLAMGLVSAFTAPGVGWYGWYRARLGRALEVAQRLL